MSTSDLRHLATATAFALGVAILMRRYINAGYSNRVKRSKEECNTVKDGVFDLIGETPMVELTTLSRVTGCVTFVFT